MPKTFVQIDKNLFIQCVKDVEENGPLDNLSDLYKNVAELYFKKDRELTVSLTPQFVMGRIKDWELEVKTQKGKKGRSSIAVDRSLLEKTIIDLEANQEFKNLSHLYIAVADEYNKQSNAKITNAIVYLRVKEWEIPVRTAKGKIGAPKGHNPSINRKSRSEKFSKDPKFASVFKELRQSLIRNDAQRFLPLVDRIEKGSMKAAVQLHCLDCCAFQTKEVRNCTAFICPQWAFRPYQKITEEQLEVDDTSEFAEDDTPEEMVA